MNIGTKMLRTLIKLIGIDGALLHPGSLQEQTLCLPPNPPRYTQAAASGPLVSFIYPQRRNTRSIPPSRLFTSKSTHVIIFRQLLYLTFSPPPKVLLALSQSILYDASTSLPTPHFFLSVFSLLHT